MVQNKKKINEQQNTNITLITKKNYVNKKANKKKRNRNDLNANEK